MIRPIAALLITILLFAGVYGYTTFVESIRRPPLQVQESFATGEFSVRITRTFDCIGDPDFDVDSLVVRFRGKDLVRRSDKVPQNEIIEIRPLENVTQLDNELYVAASLTLADSDDWDDDVRGGPSGWQPGPTCANGINAGCDARAGDEGCSDGCRRHILAGTRFDIRRGLGFL